MKSSIKIRPMMADDVERVLSIEEEAHAVPWTLGIFQDCLRIGYLCDVIEKENSIVAYSVMAVAAQEAHIFNICVASEHQRKGFGRLMMNTLIDKARLNRAGSVFLEVRPSNIVALKLYEDLGFNEIGVRKNYYPAGNGKREDALILAKQI